MQKEPVQYRQADEVAAIARDLIHKFHSHLAIARIEYVFRSITAESGGREVWGKTRKISGLNAWLASEEKCGVKMEPLPFFVIEISEPIWKRLEDKARRALVDQRLMACEVDLDTGKYSLNPYDLEEYRMIVRRHGLWHDGVEFFVKAANEGQQELPLFEMIETQSRVH